MALEAHTEVAERYVIVRTIKSGGMGSVYEAVDRHLANTPCAVKEMLEHYLDDSDENRTFVERCFAEEMRFLATLSHPHIPQVRDSFTWERRAYIVMELVQGDNLEGELARALTERGSPLSEKVVVRAALDVLDVLEYLHTQSPPVIHRDIKPANMVRDEVSGAIKLVDFGLVRSWNGSATQTSVGTLAYAPLEQIQGHAEPRSDLYSLGATMFHLLTGRIPRPLDFAPLAQAAPHVHPALAALVDRALAPVVDQRFSSAMEMKDALSSWLEPRREGHTNESPPRNPAKGPGYRPGGASPIVPVPAPPTLKASGPATEVSPPAPARLKRARSESGEWSSWLARTERTREECTRRQGGGTGSRLALAAFLVLLFGGMGQALAMAMAAGAPESPSPLVTSHRSTPRSAQSPAPTGRTELTTETESPASVSVVSSSFGSGTLDVEGRQVSISAPRDWWISRAENVDAGVRLLLQDNFQKKSIEIRLAVEPPRAETTVEQGIITRLEESGWKKQREVHEGSAPTQYVMARPAPDGLFEPAVVLAQHRPLASARSCCIVAVLRPGVFLSPNLEPDSRESQALHRTLQEMCQAFSETIGHQI